MKKIILTLVACMALTFCVEGQSQKIGTVNIRKVFDGYFKTKQADIQLKDRAAEFDAEGKKFQDEYKNLMDQYNTAQKEVQDPTITAEVKAQRSKAVEDISLKVKELETAITGFERSARTALAEQQKRHRDNILKEISDLVAKRAQSEGYALVLDIGADSIDRNRIVVFTNGQYDLTNEILTHLNANAPADILKLMEEQPISDTAE